MALEKAWGAVPATLFTADGTDAGIVTIADTAGFKVKGYAQITGNSPLGPIQVQIQRVISPTQLIVGPVGSFISPSKFTDISAYTVLLGSNISFPEQPKNKIKPDDIEQAVYESDPTVANRSVLVDQYGDFYSLNNPVPIIFDGTVEIGEVEVRGTNGNFLEPNTDGSINVVIENAPTSNSQVVSTYNEIVSVASGMTTTIVTYTVPVGKEAVLQRCPVSGDNIARYDLLINNVVQDTVRTMFGADLTQLFDFTSGNDSGLVLNAGDVVKIQVLHNRPSLGMFESRIQVLEITL